MKQFTIRQTESRSSGSYTEIIISELFDKLSVFAITFGSIAAFGSVSRIFQFGWKINILSDCATYLLLILILLLRKRFPPVFIAIAIFTLLSINACGDIILTGFATPSLIMLCSCGVALGTLFGFRIGLTFIGIATACITAISIFFIVNHLHTVFDLNQSLRSPLIWFSLISGFTVFSLASLTVVDFIKQKLVTLIKDLEQRSNELHASEKKFRLLAENMHDVLLLLNTQLHITYITPSVVTMFGFTPEELTDQRIDILAPVEKSALILTIFSRFFSHPAEQMLSISPFECTLVRKEGEEVPAEFTPSLFYDGNGELNGIQCIIRDLSTQKLAELEKKKLEQQLRHSEKLEVIGQLAGGIAHDFNNQLAGILGFSELLKASHPKDSETWETAQSIASIARHSADLTGKLLAFARKGNYRSQAVDIHILIREIIAILEHSIDPNITITQSLEAPHPFVIGDPGQIQNAFLNIALNARDAMQVGGTLSFSTRQSTVDEKFSSPYQPAITPGEYIHIIISDTGTGIDDDTKQHLFEPFFTTKAPGKGTGMGLAAVYGTIQTHGGILNVTSVVNEGTSFHIYLPVGTDTDSGAETENSPAILQGTGTLLVIEDEKNVGKMMEMVLKRLGYTVILCTNGTEGLARYEQSPEQIDAVIVDLILPGISGKELITALRAVSNTVRILICSGYRADINLQKLIEDTQTLYIQKPFSMNEFSGMLRQVLQLHNDIPNPRRAE